MIASDEDKGSLVLPWRRSAFATKPRGAALMVCALRQTIRATLPIQEGESLEGQDHVEGVIRLPPLRRYPWFHSILGRIDILPALDLEIATTLPTLNILRIVYTEAPSGYGRGRLNPTRVHQLKLVTQTLQIKSMLQIANKVCGGV